MKEKFGGLRFYWSEGERITDPRDPEPTLLDLGDDACRERCAERVRRSGLAKQLVDAAVVRASTTCELCGSPGRCSCSPRGWYQTLCPVCAERHGYVPFDDDE